MFRVVLPPIIRSAFNCIYSIWYLSHRYCYLPLSWKSWNRFECAVGSVRHPQHTQTGSNSGRAGRPDHDQQHCHHQAPKVKPVAATAVVELLLMCVTTSKTCWAVNKRQVIKWHDCCIWLVNLFELIVDDFGISCKMRILYITSA
jgi:hypothetical protein